jgi:hypothetical protein
LVSLVWINYVCLIFSALLVMILGLYLTWRSICLGSFSRFLVHSLTLYVPPT